MSIRDDIRPTSNSVITRPVDIDRLDISDDTIADLREIAKSRFPRMWRLALNAMLIGCDIATKERK